LGRLNLQAGESGFYPTQIRFPTVLRHRGVFRIIAARYIELLLVRGYPLDTSPTSGPLVDLMRELDLRAPPDLERMIRSINHMSCVTAQILRLAQPAADSLTNTLDACVSRLEL
jgi:hypothetical protein